MRNLFVLMAIILLIYSCSDEKGDQESTKLDSDTIPDYYIGPHHNHELQFANYNFENESQWDSLNGIIHNNEVRANKSIKSEYRTFGWHVYSNGTAYLDYDFSLLWGISYFSYTINPETGSYKEIHQWKTTDLVDSAKANDCKVFLTISNFGKNENIQFLNNKKAQAVLIDSVSALLALRDADGINIDFEGVPAERRKGFTDFLIDISKKLKEQDSDYQISLCLYAVDYQEVFNIDSLNSYIDFYVLMAYDYYGSFSDYAGPVTPFTPSAAFGKSSLQTSVEYYLGLGVEPSDLIVALPYYGAEWVVEKGEQPNRSISFYADPPYRSIKRTYLDSMEVPVQFNQQCSCTFLNIETTDSSLRQLWFEDTSSLALKYEWLKSKKISGVGIWALGYDHGYSDLWELLSIKFGETNNKKL